MYNLEGMEEGARERVEGARKKQAIVHGNTRLSQEFLKKTQVVLREAVGMEGPKLGRPSAVRTCMVGVDGVVVGEADSPPDYSPPPPPPRFCMFWFGLHVHI